MRDYTKDSSSFSTYDKKTFLKKFIKDIILEGCALNSEGSTQLGRL